MSSEAVRLLPYLKLMLRARARLREEGRSGVVRSIQEEREEEEAEEKERQGSMRGERVPMKTERDVLSDGKTPER